MLGHRLALPKHELFDQLLSAIRVTGIIKNTIRNISVILVAVGVLPSILNLASEVSHVVGAFMVFLIFLTVLVGEVLMFESHVLLVRDVDWM